VVGSAGDQLSSRLSGGGEVELVLNDLEELDGLSGQLSFHFRFRGDAAQLIELNGLDRSAPP
jgi:hypothetical protein